MKNKEKLLIVSAVSPFPKTSGGAVRIYNEIRYLSKQFKIYFVFFTSMGQALQTFELEFLRKYSKKFVAFSQKSKRDLFSFINKFQPYWFSNWDDEELKIFLPNFIKENGIKKVQIEFTQLLYLCSFIPENVKKNFVALDISTVSFWRRLKEIRDPFTFVIHFIRWLEVYFYEKFYFSKFDLIVSMSNNDENILRNKFHINNTLTVPNGIENIVFLEKKVDEYIINLGYIGSFKHPPNRNAVIYFIKKIAPILENNKIDFRYFLAGDIDTEELNLIISRSKLKNISKIVTLGQVNDVQEFYEKIDILIAPIFSGSGSRIKILEALSFGVPVITSKIGAEGIELNTNFLKIADSSKKYLFFIKQIFYNLSSKLYKENEIALKNQISQLLWEKIFKKYGQTRYIRD